MNFKKVVEQFGVYYQSGDYFISVRDATPGIRPVRYQAYRAVAPRAPDRRPWTVENRGLFKDVFGRNNREFLTLAEAKAAVRKFAASAEVAA